MTQARALRHELKDYEARQLLALRALRRDQRELGPSAAAPRLTLGERVADRVAATMGSWPFIVTQTVMLAIWIGLNITAFVQRWDPYPFILLNLALSFQAAYAAPFIMMSQNRRQDIDRQQAATDYRVNVKAELEVELLHEKLDHLRENEVLALTQAVERLTELLQEARTPARAKRGRSRAPG
ncbi:DUF1003 domain-containing protein [uncultured Phenylobacterium sp.]|uniref:DUF1003 domain-containing protein n=1 Tax=uncultured Phenylobacterium sp. TaxID=349273 RepID=UPI0025D8DEB0|nr:DUF1003 domain-containing protein [uncultured Phenylobacterium sp.]